MMFSKMAGDPIKTQNFIKSSMEFIKRHNFDGLDIDWEYPSQRGGKKEDNENFVKLLASLRRECDIEGKLLTVAVGASTTMIGDSYDVRGISNYVDLICLMTYDYNAYWSYRVDHNAPLAGHSPQNVKRTVESWIERGAEPHKIILGIATYGQTFKINANSGCKVGTPAIGPGTQGPFTKQAGMKAYYEFCNMDDEWLYTYDSIARVPMLESPTECISYDNEDSIREKGKFANEMGLGGLMTWEVDFDDFRGECGKKFPLLKAMNDVMGYSQVEENPSKPVTSKPNTSKPSPPQDKDKCSHNELYPHESDCGLFYQCNHNKRIVMNCPTGLQYDKDLQGCNYPEFVNCITQN